MPGHDNAPLWGLVRRHEFRLTIYAYNGSILTPRAGAPHSDPFQVTTQANPPAPWKPYMSRPNGWRGRLDILTAHSEQGEVTVSLADARIGINNLERWVSAFAGDENNFSALKHCRAFLEESFDGGTVWTPYYTGVVHIQTIEDPKTAGPRYDLVIKDPRIQEHRKIFVGIPHRTITYAMPAPVFPIGVPVMKNRTSNRGWNGLVSTQPAYFRTRATTTGSFILQVQWVGQYSSGTVKRRRGKFLLSTELASLADRVEENTSRARAVNGKICENLRILMRPVGSTGAFTQVYVSPQPNTVVSGSIAYDGASEVSPIWIDNQGYVMAVGATMLPTGHADRMALVNATTYEGYIVNAGPPRRGSPLLIDHVNNIQLWRDIQAGLFGHMGDDGEPIADAVSIDESVATLFEDSFVSTDLRFLITEPQDQQAFCEQQIFIPSGIAARTNRDGEVELIYTRLREIATGVVITPSTLPSAACVSIRKSLGQKILGGVTIKGVTYGFTDELDLELKEEERTRQENKSGAFFDAPGGGVYSRETKITFLGARAHQVGEAPHEINVLGIEPPKLYPGFDLDSIVYDQEVKIVQGSSHQLFHTLARSLLDWFEDGAGEVTLVCRRISEVEALDQGDFIVVDADEIPNPSSNVRGGPRLYMILEREENFQEVRFILLDAGPNQSPVAPTIGAISLVGSPQTNPQVTVTLNANSDRALLEYAVTDAAVVVLPETGWLVAALLDATDTVQLTEPLDGQKIWFRASTLRTREQSVPSGWVYPSNNGLSITIVPRLTSVYAELEGETVVLYGVPNSATAGVRLHYDIHDKDVEPSLASTYIDFASTAFPITLDLVVLNGEQFSFIATPYPTWNGTVVSGTPGVPVPGTVLAGDGGLAPVTVHSWTVKNSKRALRLAVEPTDATIKYRFGSTGAWSSAPGPSVDVNVDLSTGSQIIEFYSISVNGDIEDLHRLQLDENDNPDFDALVLTEISANRLQAALSLMDDDTIRWSLWAKVGSLPYLTGSDGELTNEPDPRYLRDEGPPTRQPRQFHAINGTWNVIARVYDNRGRFTEKTATITIVGSGESLPELTGLSVALVGGNHRITWGHNVSVTGSHRVVIRETVAGVTREVLTLATARPPTWEAGSSADTVASAGGYDVPVQTGSTFKHFDYEVLVYDGTTFVRSYTLSIEGSNYSNNASGAPTVSPGNLVLSNLTTGAIQSDWQNASSGDSIELLYEWYDAGQWRTQTLVQVSPGTVTHQTGGITVGREIRLYARYTNANGPGPWSNASNTVTVT